MDTEIKKLKKITRFMQKQGILSLKTAGIEIQLAPHAITFPLGNADIDVKEDDKLLQTPQPSEEDLLLWSAPGAI